MPFVSCGTRANLNDGFLTIHHDLPRIAPPTNMTAGERAPLLAGVGIETSYLVGAHIITASGP